MVARSAVSLSLNGDASEMRMKIWIKATKQKKKRRKRKKNADENRGRKKNFKIFALTFDSCYMDAMPGYGYGACLIVRFYHNTI